ncbi:hypothetical protein DKP78_17630, partial [Enterococcus faecium]
MAHRDMVRPQSLILLQKKQARESEREKINSITKKGLNNWDIKKLREQTVSRCGPKCWKQKSC